MSVRSDESMGRALDTPSQCTSIDSQPSVVEHGCDTWDDEHDAVDGRVNIANPKAVVTNL
jgi:hypothetical protein